MHLVRIYVAGIHDLADVYKRISQQSEIISTVELLGIIKIDYMEYIMTNSDLLTIDENLLIYVNENVVFQYHQDNQLSQYFSINERGVRRSFQEFIGFAEENGWLHDADGTTRRMKEILEEYKRRFETV